MSSTAAENAVGSSKTASSWHTPEKQCAAIGPFFGWTFSIKNEPCPVVSFGTVVQNHQLRPVFGRLKSPLGETTLSTVQRATSLADGAVVPQPFVFSQPLAMLSTPFEYVNGAADKSGHRFR